MAKTKLSSKGQVIITKHVRSIYNLYIAMLSCLGRLAWQDFNPER